MLLKLFSLSFFSLIIAVSPLKAQEMNATVEPEEVLDVEQPVMEAAPLVEMPDIPAEVSPALIEDVVVPENLDTEAVKDIIPEPAMPVLQMPTIAPHNSNALSPAEEKEKVKADQRQRRADWMKANPDQLKKMQENRLKRQQWMRDNPEEARKLKEESRKKQLERKLKMQAEQK